MNRHPTNVPALNNIANLLAAPRGNVGRSEPAGRRRSAGDDRTGAGTGGHAPNLLDTRTVVLLAANKVPEALANARRVVGEQPIQMDPTRKEDQDSAVRWSKYWFRLALAHQAAGDANAAREAFQRARQLGLTRDELDLFERPAFDQLPEG